MQIRRFGRELGKALWNDNLGDVAAMMAYYAVMAIVPMVIFVGSLALLVLPDATIRQGLAMGTEAMPAGVRDVIVARVDALIIANQAGFAIGSAAFALWGASRGAVGVASALSAIYSKPETRSWVRRQATAFAVTIVVAVMVVVALALLVLGPYAGHWVGDRFGLGPTFDLVWQIGRWTGAGLLVMLVWAIVYKYLPDTDAPFRVFTPGAFTGVLVWLGASALFGFYIQNLGSYATTYGALGTAIVFLLWLWLSNIALLFGAEVNDVLADVRSNTSVAAAQLADPHEQAHASHV